MRIDADLQVKIAQCGEALATGWNALADSRIIPSMVKYEETSLSMAFTRVLTALIVKLPDDE